MANGLLGGLGGRGGRDGQAPDPKSLINPVVDKATKAAKTRKIQSTKQSIKIKFGDKRKADPSPASRDSG